MTSSQQWSSRNASLIHRQRQTVPTRKHQQLCYWPVHERGIDLPRCQCSVQGMVARALLLGPLICLPYPFLQYALYPLYNLIEKFRNAPSFLSFGSSALRETHMAVCQNLVPLVKIKIAGKWMFIPLKMVLIGIDPYQYLSEGLVARLQLLTGVHCGSDTWLCIQHS